MKPNGCEGKSFIFSFRAKNEVRFFLSESQSIKRFIKSKVVNKPTVFGNYSGTFLLLNTRYTFF